MTDYFNRDLSSPVLEALGEMPVVVITGLRQTGKTTFLQRQPGFGQRRYVTFDDFAQLEAAKSDPDGFVSDEEPLTIDEAHKCPEIFTAIKKSVDRKRESGQFLLSGSANLGLLKGISESLAGRSIYFVMHPFNRREITRKIAKQSFLENFFETQEIIKTKDLRPIQAEDILNGGMPIICLGEVKNRFLWFKGYEQTYLERDVRELSRIDNIIAFRNLLHLTALRTGKLLSPSELARDAKLPVATVSRYLSLFETSFIITRLNPYLKNRATRLIKSPKLYLSDSGLACYLTGLNRIEFTSSQPLTGSMFETYIAQNLLSLIQGRWPSACLYFWSVQGRNEVDFIIEVNNHCIALEIKSGTRWQERDLSGLKAFLTATPHCKAAILGYNGTEIVKLGEKIWALPLSLILS
jgi:predicted AAA+ superfamily ATPase